MDYGSAKNAISGVLTAFSGESSYYFEVGIIPTVIKMNYNNNQIEIPFAKHTTAKQKQSEKEWISEILSGFSVDIERKGRYVIVNCNPSNFDGCKKELERILIVQ